VRKWIPMAATALAGAAVGALTVYVLSDGFLYHGRKDIDLDAWVGGESAWASVMPGAHWATADLCGDELPCTQAVQADTLTMYRFAERDDAVVASRTFAGEAYTSGWIVVRFNPDGLTPAQRTEFVTSLDCINVGIAEGGVEC
jgi:hypothetical protein